MQEKIFSMSDVEEILDSLIQKSYDARQDYIRSHGCRKKEDVEKLNRLSAENAAYFNALHAFRQSAGK